MAKNLNVNIEGSVCYDNDPANCEKYGRLYTWEAAMNACPSGWHLPSKEEMETFIEAVKLRVEQIVTPKKLNAEPLKKDEDKFYNHLRDSSWETSRVNGFNTFGFSALPAGSYESVLKKFDYLGTNTFFWSSTEYNSNRAYELRIYYGSALVRDVLKTNGSSVRCLRDFN